MIFLSALEYLTSPIPGLESKIYSTLLYKLYESNKRHNVKESRDHSNL